MGNLQLKKLVFLQKNILGELPTEKILPQKRKKIEIFL